MRAEPIGFTFWGGTGKINKLENSTQYVLFPLAFTKVLLAIISVQGALKLTAVVADIMERVIE